IFSFFPRKNHKVLYKERRLSSAAHQSLPENAKGRKRTEAAGYQQPTVASRARTPSPYTHRKMCQLSEDARQRLAHLQLGPHHFMKETKLQPPFLVDSTAALKMLLEENREGQKGLGCVFADLEKVHDRIQRGEELEAAEMKMMRMDQE
uniref:Uncharacterized protein n=1 Tax=Oryzias latipes TaxID=8090 RepID=A0A3P9J6L9_ORYLA